MALLQNPYQSLREGEFRTLSLAVSPSGDTIHATLNVERLANAKYWAVSYAWGDETDRGTIQLNGQPWSITRNAYEVLKGLLLPGSVDKFQSYSIPRGPHVWLDAICINQNDEKEKELQIGFMQDIYAGASLTLIQLGTPVKREHAGLACEYFRRLLTSGTKEVFLDSRPEYLHGRFWKDESWNVVCDMIMQPWHHRRWIIQEAVLSKKPWILYGDQQMLWTDFVEAFERSALVFSARILVLGRQTHLYPRFIDITPTLAMADLRDRLAKQDRQPRILHLLNCFRRNACKDPRDRIYALLGLCSEQERQANKPDLSMDLRETLIRYAVQHVRNFQDLDILCLAIEDARLEQRPSPGMPVATVLEDLPTWCPNITSHHAFWTYGHDSIVRNESSDPYFRASGHRKVKAHEIELWSKSGVMLVSGVEIDEIAQLHNSRPMKSPQHDEPTCEAFDGMFDLAKRHSLVALNGNALALLTSFFRTITGGGRRAATRDFVSDQYLRHYMLDWFKEAKISQKFRTISNESLPEDPSAWYTDPEAHTRYGPGQTPSLDRSKLCFARFACTKNGRMAMVPPHTIVGDRICVLYGRSSPVLLQPIAKPYKGLQTYFHRGEAFVDGYMHGEAIDGIRKGVFEEQRFAIR